MNKYNGYAKSDAMNFLLRKIEIITQKCIGIDISTWNWENDSDQCILNVVSMFYKSLCNAYKYIRQSEDIRSEGKRYPLM